MGPVARGAAVLAIALPALVGLGGALYSFYRRDYPWGAALAVGLAVGTLAFAALRAWERLRGIYRRSNQPWHRE